MMPSRLEDGQHEYRGYCEWAVHPNEAKFLLDRGYAIVNGERCHVWFIHEEEFVTQLRIENSDPEYISEHRFVDSGEAR